VSREDVNVAPAPPCMKTAAGRPGIDLDVSHVICARPVPTRAVGRIASHLASPNVGASPGVLAGPLRARCRSHSRPTVSPMTKPDRFSTANAPVAQTFRFAAAAPSPSSGTVVSPAEHDRMANAIRALAMDAVEKAKSGHPGSPMGAADIATVLFTRFLKFDPADPAWPDRDRFVLSAGHGSMLLYALLHLLGQEEMTIEQIKQFRQLGSVTPGHPEYGHTPGVETTTGPLDGHDSAAIAGAIEAAKRSDRPSLIACRTTIGFGAPNKGGTEKSHGAALGPERSRRPGRRWAGARRRSRFPPIFASNGAPPAKQTSRRGSPGSSASRRLPLRRARSSNGAAVAKLAMR